MGKDIDSFQGGLGTYATGSWRCGNSDGWCYAIDPYSSGPDFVEGPAFTYPDVFAAAVSALMGVLKPAGYTNYRIMPGGVLGPTGGPSCQTSHDLTPFGQNILLVQRAIYAAEYASGRYDPDVRAHLAVAVHPYQYGMPGFSNFAQYVAAARTDYVNASGCRRLDNMLGFWKTGFPVPASGSDLSGYGGSMIDTLLGLPLFFTEVNWNGKGFMDSDGKTDDVQADWQPNNKGSYLVDLFTWLNDSQYNTGDPDRSPLRVLWFDGADFDDAHAGGGLLGIYDANVPRNALANHGELPVTIPFGPKASAGGKYQACAAQVKGPQSHFMSADFVVMLQAACR